MTATLGQHPPSALAGESIAATETRSPRLRLGVAAACALGNIFGMSTLIFSTFPMFLMPVTTSLGWSAATFSFTLTIIAIVCFFAYPLGGLLMDRFGARPVILIGNVILGLSIMLLGTMTPGRFYGYLLFVLVGACAALPSTVLLSRVISSWFRENRATALAVASGLAFGVGAAINPLIAQAVIAEWGWRAAYGVLGALPLLIANPVMWFLLREPPTQPGDERPVDDETKSPDDGVTLAVAARTRHFWLLLFSAALAPGAVMAITSHVVPLFAANGLGVGIAAAAISASAMTSAIWQLALGRLLDRTGDPRIAGLCLVAAAIGVPVILTATSQLQAVAGAILLGVGAGTEYALLPYAVSHYFGLRHYGLVYGFLFGVVSLIIGAAAVTMDLVQQVTGSYAVPAWSCGAILAFCALCLFLLHPFQARDLRRD